MDCGFWWPDDIHLVAVLKELDMSKALVRKAQDELGKTSSQLRLSGDSQACLSAFAAVNRSLNQEMQRYRAAVTALNRVCHKPVLAEVA
jgi:hypothetical protein